MLRLIAILSLLSISFAVHAAKPSACVVMLTGKTLSGQVIERPFNPSESWGLQIYELKLDFILEFVERTKTLVEKEKIKLLMDEDVRRYFFQLQGLSRSYQAHDSVYFKALRGKFKEVEDAIGAVDLFKKLRKIAGEIREKNTSASVVSAMERLESYFEAKEEVANKKVLVMLTQWDRPQIDKLRLELRSYKKWYKGGEDVNFLIDNLQHEAKDLERDVKNMKFDDPDIELGLHELRRRIRWIVLDVLSLNHLIKYTMEDGLPQSVMNWFNELEKSNPNMLTNKYMTIDETLLDEPIQIPRRLEAIFTTIVDNIGNLKDVSERQIEMERAMKEIKLSSSEIAAAMSALNIHLGVNEKLDHQELSRQYQRKIYETDILKTFSRELKRLNQ